MSFIYNLPQGVKFVPPHGLCNGGHILVILRSSPHLHDDHVLFWLYYDNASPLNEQTVLNVLNLKSAFCAYASDHCKNGGSHFQ